MSTSVSRNAGRWALGAVVVIVVGAASAISLSQGNEPPHVVLDASRSPEAPQAIRWPRLIEYRLTTLYTDDPNGPMRESIHIFRGASYDEWTDEQLSTTAPEPRQCWVVLDMQLYDASNGCDSSFRAGRVVHGEGASPNPYLAPVDTSTLADTPSDELTEEEVQLAQQLRLSPDDLHASMAKFPQSCAEVGFLNCSDYDSSARERLHRVVVHVPSGLKLIDRDIFDGDIITEFVVQDIQRGRPYDPPARAKEAQRNRER